MTPDNASLSEEHEKTDVVSRPASRRSWRSWIFALAVLGAALLLQGIAKRAPHFVEHYYSRTVFPRFGHALSFFNGWFSFSLAEILVVGLIGFVVGGVVYQTLRVLQTPRRAGAVIGTSLLTLLWGLSSALMLFLLLWGLNYHREPLGKSLGLAKRTATDDQIEALSRSIINEVNANYQLSHEGGSGGSLNRTRLYGEIEDAYHNVPLLTGLCGGGYARPKPIRLSGIMSWFGISGIYMPFTGEANFNSLQPDFDLPYVIAHEKAHQCGVAREDEANFIAFLVCSNSPDPFVRYSGYLNSLRVVSALRVAGPERYRNVVGTLGAGPRADLTARSAFWARYQGRGMVLGHRINNSYLRANNVPGGTRSYSEDVALIISYYLQNMEKADR
ncbi:MAG: hypothetical protein QOD75_3261 [Blastocatellia bacterium]|jgi:hypothetical protein|nr:hypothetical protein [Blastocatellia bacterium]